MFPIFHHKPLSKRGFTTFIQNFCFQLLFITFIHNFRLNILSYYIYHPASNKLFKSTTQFWLTQQNQLWPTKAILSSWIAEAELGRTQPPLILSITQLIPCYSPATCVFTCSLIMTSKQEVVKKDSVGNFWLPLNIHILK